MILDKLGLIVISRYWCWCKLIEPWLSLAGQSPGWSVYAVAESSLEREDTCSNTRHSSLADIQLARAIIQPALCIVTP